MKFRNQFLKYKMHGNTDDGAGGGGGTSNGNDGGENNSDTDLPNHANLWDNDPNDEPAGGQQQQQQQGGQLSATEAFNQHVSNIDFGGDANTMMEAVRNGDTEAFAAQLKDMQVGIYRAAMLDANKMMQQTSGQLKTELQKSTETTISSDKIINAMNEQLPYTAEPAYAPMAKAVVSRLLSKKGMTPERAIQETGEYFSNMAKKVGGNMNGNMSHRSSNDFGNDDSQSGDMDWVEFLGGKPE